MNSLLTVGNRDAWISPLAAEQVELPTLDAETLAILDEWVEEGEWLNNRTYNSNGAWVGGEPKEERAEVRDIFLDCFQEKSPLIDLHHRHLSTLPDIFESFPFLTMIDARQNKLTSLPESLCKLPSLKTLNLFSNWFKTLPENIGNLSTLEDLSLNLNGLEVLPESLARLTSLTRLDLWGHTSKLKTLPKHFGNLVSLKELWLPDNQLEFLPVSFAELHKLQQVVGVDKPGLEKLLINNAEKHSSYLEELTQREHSLSPSRKPLLSILAFLEQFKDENPYSFCVLQVSKKTEERSIE